MPLGWQSAQPASLVLLHGDSANEGLGASALPALGAPALPHLVFMAPEP